MKPTVYVETSIIGYLASRPSRDLVTAANQQLTHTWWHDYREYFEVFVSQFVLVECAAGDPTAAQERMEYLVGIRRLTTGEEAKLLADELMKEIPLPSKAEVDSLHIATAMLHGMDYLLTWNCTHIANAEYRREIERISRARGLEPPIICTPQELIGCPPEDTIRS